MSLKRGIKPAVVFVVIAAALVSSTLAADEAADKGKILAMENAWNQAQLHHDSRALNALISDKFVYTDWDGTIMTKAQFLADAKDPSTTMTLVANKEVDIFLYHRVAIVVGIYHAKGKTKGKAFDHWGRFTDTWIFEDDHWVCIASHTNLMKKPVT